MMTWVERKIATSMVSNFPTATIDEALVAFQNSEGLKPNHWIDNQLYIAKVCRGYTYHSIYICIHIHIAHRFIWCCNGTAG